MLLHSAATKFTYHDREKQFINRKRRLTKRREGQEEKEEEYLGERKSSIGENSLQVNGSPSRALIA